MKSPNKTLGSVTYNLIFVLVFICISFYYNLHQSSFMRPQGLHQWRQSLGAAYAMNYYNYNLDPSQSRIYNHIVDEGESDIAFAEFPVLYYSIAVLYKIIGPNESIFRTVNLLILFLGLFYLKKSLELFFKNHIWALLVSILAFTSATLVYYSNSFIPDTTAFGISFIALYHFLKFIDSGDRKYILWSGALYSLAGLLKVSSLIPFMAIVVSYLIYFVFQKDFRKQYPIKHFIIPIAMPFIGSFLWYLFVYTYHSAHGGNISAVEIRPIWILDSETISQTFQRIWEGWLGTYFNPSILAMALLLYLGTIFYSRKWGKLMFPVLVFSFLGSIAFFFLFFRSLYNHDYYLISTFFLVIFAFAIGLKRWIELKKAAWLHYLSVAVFSVILLFLIVDAKTKAQQKLHGFNIWHTKWFHGLEDIEPELRNIGILPTDKVISIPDPSINISLNMMNQPGFTDFIRMNIPVEERIDFQISKGAKYLVLGDSLLYQKDKRAYVEKYMMKKILTHENIVVYDLRGFE